MTIITSFDNSRAPSLQELASIFKEKGHPAIPKGEGGIWEIVNEISPDTLYCYLQAKFGNPNGLQNVFRSDDSDNLIHWEWALTFDNGIMLIMGLNLRTEVHLLGDWGFSSRDRDQFIRFIKSDLSNYGKEMSSFRRNELEHWDIFTNPYHDINSSIMQMLSDIHLLELNPDEDQISFPDLASEMERYAEQMKLVAEKYNRATGMALGLKSLIPVLAESFLNLVLYLTCKPEIKGDKRLYDSVIRSNVDIKVKSLHLHCQGFKSAADWSSKPCSEYNSIVNERNDLLHGNFNIDKLKYTDIHFRGKVPIFKQYVPTWQQSIAVSIRTSGLTIVEEWLNKVRAFEDYVLSNLEDGYEKHIRYMMARRDLGINRENGRIGILLPDHVVDFRMSRVH